MGVGYALAWVAIAFVIASVLFLSSSRTITIASHDAVVRPNLTGRLVLQTGPVLPDLRIDSGSVIGVDIRLGKTNAESTGGLVQRYALLASQPDGPVTKLRSEISGMAFDAATKGAILAVLPLLLWVLVGSRRRRDLLSQVPSVQGVAVVSILALVGVGLWTPWDSDDETLDRARSWQTLGAFLGSGVFVPSELGGVEVRGDVTTAQTRMLVESAVSTFDNSKKFYATAAEDAADLDLREPGEDETVVTLVSDRHDNIGMDAVARAIGDAGGATAVFNAGDDTSTGSQWEAFSLDSVDAAFNDQDRWGVAGNHDSGDFVTDYFLDLGWTMLDSEVVDGPGDSRLLGVADPRSSGLGNWRSETDLTFGEVRDRLGEEACRLDEEGDRVTTMLVHDANLGDDALQRGCVDLVVGGHLHVQEDAERIEGENGQVGYAFTTGTTGGAAYAIAIGSKIRRQAQVTLITYAEGRPIGLQSVILQTNGRFDVEDFVELDY